MFSRHTHNNIFRLFSFIIIFLLLNYSAVNAQCTSVSESDSLALVDFYSTTNGADWINNEAWLSSPVSEWYGITLTSDGCSIKSINLGFNQIEGTLPDLNLPNLEELVLLNNRLSGDIPDFSNLPNLKRLYLGNTTASDWLNELVGEVPDFSNLPLLEVLHLGQNRLSGDIPDFSNLPNLKTLELGNSASFQTPFTEMESNDLVGEVPDFSNLPNLINLGLAGNQLTGDIPDFSNLPNLQSLNLAENLLTGNIPNFSNIDSLYYLQLLGNSLTGSIPDFDNLPNLENMNLSDNQLSGSIPDFSNLSQIKYLYLNKNILGGSIPDFSNIDILETLNIEENQLTGDIPDFSNIANVTSIVAGLNRLTGEIPNFSNLPQLIYFSCNANQLTGEIPDFSNLPIVECLIFSENDLTGGIPNFSNLLNLNNLHLDENNLSGNIPNFDNLLNLENLYLHKNELFGSIPNFDNLPNLINLFLYENNLSGFIPNFENLTNLGALYIDHNQLMGNVPDFDLPNLALLTVCPNLLSGSIPSFSNTLLTAINEIDFSCLEAAQATGYIYADFNENCIKEIDEPIIPNAIISTTDSTAYAFSDENGFYTLKLDSGTHSFNCTIPNYLWEQFCIDSPLTYTVNINSTADSLGGYDFGIQPLALCPLLVLEVGTPLLRRCFTNTYTINYCNIGTAAAENASIKLVLDEAITPLNSSLPYVANADDELIFDIGTVEIGDCGFFTLTDSLSCNAALGSTACVEAYAFPNDLCFENNELWDGSDLKINTFCLGNEIVFEIENVGDDMEQESEYRMYEDDILSAFDGFQLAAGDKLTLNASAMGQTFRLTAYQNPNHPSSIFVTEAIELCGATAENASLGFVTTQSNLDYTQFYDIECQEIIGSYDPNDKSVIPKGVGDENRITDSVALEYKIRFQNIGNDTAFRVVIIDTIDTDFLNLNSLQLGVSSHDYTAEIINSNVLMFTFENILLVDSTTNEPESHGFVQFKISQQAGNQRDDLIENNAGIYFDYNEPVITNKAFNFIGLPDSTTAIAIVSQIKNDIPAKVCYENNHLHIHLSLVANNEQYAFTLYDVLGKKIKQEHQLLVPYHKMSVGNLTKGVYIFEIETNSGKQTNGKFVVL